MEKDITLRKNEELRCPHCGDGGLTVRCVHIQMPTDGIVFTFNTDPLRLSDIDGGGCPPAYAALFVNCPNCSPKGDAFYLYVTDGDAEADDGIKVVRAHWSTDEGAVGEVAMRD